MKRLPILLCVPALIVTAACSAEPDTTATDTELQNDTMTTDGTMMAPEEMPTTNGNGAAGTTGTMGTDGSVNSTGTMGNTMGSSGDTTGSTMGGSTMGGSTTDPAMDNRTGTTPDRETPPE